MPAVPVRRKGVAQRVGTNALSGPKPSSGGAMMQASNGSGAAREKHLAARKSAETGSAFGKSVAPSAGQASRSEKAVAKTMSTAKATTTPITKPTAKPTTTVSATGKPLPKASSFGKPTASSSVKPSTTESSAPKPRKPREKFSAATATKNSTDPQFTHLGIQNRYQKFGRSEPKPDISQLELIDPKTGKSVPGNETGNDAPRVGQAAPANAVKRKQSEPSIARPAPGRKESAPQATVPPAIRQPPTGHTAITSYKPTLARTWTEPAITAPQSAAPPSRPADIHSAYGRRNSPPRRAQRAPSPPTPQAVLRSEVQAPPPMPSGAAYKRTTCRDWQAGNCKYTTETCGFAHWNALPPKDQVTCFYWRRPGGCKLPDHICEFAHHETGNIAPRPPGFEVVNAPQPKKQPSLARLSAAASKKRTTCFYWKRPEGCKWSDDECEFAHYETGINAGEPGSFKASGVWESELQLAAERERRARADVPKQDDSTAPAGSHMSKEKPVTGAETIRPITDVARSHAQQKKTTTTVDTVRRPTVIEDEVSMTISPDHVSLDRGNPSPDTDPASTTSQRMIEEDLTLAKRSINDLDATALLTRRVGKQIGGVYIHMSEEREGERKLLDKFFTDFHCKVFHSGIAQHWNFFQKTYEEGLVVVHPDETFVNSPMQGLAEMLIVGGGIWMASIGVREVFDGTLPRPRRYESQRIFPMAMFTFISDDVFLYYPEKATEIIKSFYESAKVKPAGAETSKIGARPGVRDWLSDLALKKLAESNNEDDRWFKCWDAISSLCPVEDYDPYDMQLGRMVTSPSALLWSEAAEDLPSFQGMWDKDEARATDMMANFFAGTAVTRIEHFRRFIFVYARPGQMELDENAPASQVTPEQISQHKDPHGWMKKYPHMAVMSPDDWMRMEKKRAVRNPQGK